MPALPGKLAESGRSEAARSPPGVLQGIYLVPLDGLDPGDDELGDAVAALQGEGGLSQVDQDHSDLPPVVAVDRAWSVEDADAVAEGEAAPRTDLAFPAAGDLQHQTGGDEQALAGTE